MPVPKRKTSKARRDKRQSTKFIRVAAVTACQNCASPLNPHVACAQCGFYKGVKVLTTKLERAIKRGEARTALAQKAQAREAAESHHEEAK